MSKTIIMIMIILTPFLSKAQDDLTDDELALSVIGSTTAWIRNGDRSSSNYRNRGVAYEQLDSLALALKDYTTAISIDPSNADLYQLRASLNFEMNLYKESVSDYTKAIELNQSNLDNYVGRGAANAMLSRTQSAYDDYAYVLAKDSINEEALFNRAILYWSVTEKKQSTLNDFARLIKHYPTSKYYYNRGQYLLESKDYKMAIKDLQKATDLESGNITYQLEKAYCLGMIGRDSEANSRFSICEKLDPRNAEIYWRRGLWRKHQRKTALACIDFRKAQSLGMNLDDLLKECK